MRIKLTTICEESNWHLATVIDRLYDAGLLRKDAEAFAAFAFADHAEVRDQDPEDVVTDEQWEQLETTGDGWVIDW